MVGLTRIELVTSSLSGTRSNQLSYKPAHKIREGRGTYYVLLMCEFHLGEWRLHAYRLLLRKEVIQPLVPQRLPCYDFIPITPHTLGGQMPDFGCRQLS